MKLSFFVPGEPIPKGSWKALKSGRLVPDNKRSAKWEEAVAWAARAATCAESGQQRWITHDGPVVLMLRFLLTRPTTALGEIDLPSCKPDLDKLVRAVGDALKGSGVYSDDSRVVTTFSTKHWSTGPQYTGVVVDVVPHGELTLAMVLLWTLPDRAFELELIPADREEPLGGLSGRLRADLLRDHKTRWRGWPLS